jgi:hypothetical protein
MRKIDRNLLLHILTGPGLLICGLLALLYFVRNR